MRTAICTLSEGNYHYGVGALINSLLTNQFNGDFFIGYRGNLPKWVKNAVKTEMDGWNNVTKMMLKNGSSIYFFSLDTTSHFTNYKPQFLIQLTSTCCRVYDAIAYFDPDIVVCRNWTYFEDWMQYGVAVVHDIITNDMPITHPLRQQWEHIAKQCNQEIYHSIDSYINAGF